MLRMKGYDVIVVGGGHAGIDLEGLHMARFYRCRSGGVTKEKSPITGELRLRNRLSVEALAHGFLEEGPGFVGAHAHHLRDFLGQQVHRAAQSLAV